MTSLIPTAEERQEEENKNLHAIGISFRFRCDNGKTLDKFVWFKVGESPIACSYRVEEKVRSYARKRGVMIWIERKTIIKTAINYGLS